MPSGRQDEDVIELSPKTKLPSTLSDKVGARDKATHLSFSLSSDPTVLHKYWACVPTREYRRKVASGHTCIRRRSKQTVEHLCKHRRRTAV